MLKDFLFDGVSASSMGLMIGGFDEVSDSVSIGNVLYPTTFRPSRSQRNRLAAMGYDDVYTVTFSVCKDLCAIDDIDYLTNEQVNRIARWLIQEEGYKKFQPIYDDGVTDVYYMGFFKLSVLSLNGHAIGFELEFTADSPYAYQEYALTPIQSGSAFVDISDKTGYLYADLDVVVKENGDLTIQNDRDPDNKIIVKDVKAGDRYTFYGESKIFDTHELTGRLNNNFNYNFLRIVNSLNNRNNVISANLNCEMKIKYTPVRRVGVIL